MPRRQAAPSRASSAQWWSDWPRWYPSVDEVAQLPPDALQSQRHQTASRIERTVLSLLGFGTYCVVALESPDSLLLLETPSVRLPFVDHEISFMAFLLVAPVLLLGIWLYLHILVRHRRIEMAAMVRHAIPRSPDSSEARHPFLKVIALTAYLVAAPLIMLDFAYKSAAVPGYGVWMLMAAIIVLAIHLRAALSAMTSVWPRRVLHMAVGIGLVAALGRCWVGGDAIVRPYNLYRADLSGAFLPMANLRGAYAARANFEGAVLIEADLTDVHFGNARMAGADLSGATVTDAYFGWTDLSRANLSGADLRGSRFLHADLREANLVSANLAATSLSGVNAEGARLDLARLDRARIENSSFRSASLRGASLEGVQDNSANLAGPSLSPTKGVALSADQRGQLDTTSDVKPIYDSNGNIIGDDRERLMSREKMEEFFRGVEGRSDTGETPGTPAVAP